MSETGLYGGYPSEENVTTERNVKVRIPAEHVRFFWPMDLRSKSTLLKNIGINHLGSCLDVIVDSYVTDTPPCITCDSRGLNTSSQCVIRYSPSWTNVFMSRLIYIWMALKAASMKNVCHHSWLSIIQPRCKWVRSRGLTNNIFREKHLLLDDFSEFFFFSPKKEIHYGDRHDTQNGTNNDFWNQYICMYVYISAWTTG